VREAPVRRRVYVAARLERGALLGPPRRRRVTGVVGVRREAVEDLRQVGVDPGDGGPDQGAGEVAVLAVRWAPFGEVDAPVGARRDRLQAQLRRRGDHYGEGRLGLGVGLPVGLARQPGDAVGGELDDLRAERRGPLGGPGRQRPLPCAGGDEHPLGDPGLGRAGRDPALGELLGPGHRRVVAEGIGIEVRRGGAHACVLPAVDGRDRRRSDRRTLSEWTTRPGWPWVG